MINSFEIQRMDARTGIEKAKAVLGDVGIDTFPTWTHDAVMTSEEHIKAIGDLPTGSLLIKNLFLKDKKSNLYLLCIPFNLKVDLKSVQQAIVSNANPSSPLEFPRPSTHVRRRQTPRYSSNPSWQRLPSLHHQRCR